MSGAATAIMAVASVAGLGLAAHNGHQQKKAAKNAQRQAQQSALKQERAADEATNRANQKRANPGAALDAAMQAGKGGAGGTMLTGPSGIDPDALTLGKNTLLGA